MQSAAKMWTSGFGRATRKFIFIFSYKPSIRKACEEIVKTSGTEIAHILVDKNSEVDTDIMNCLTPYLLFSHFIRSHACCVHGTESPLYHSLSQSGRSLRQFSLRKLRQHRSSLRIPNSPCLAQVHRSRHVLRRDAGIHLRAHSVLLFAFLHRIQFILDPSKIGTLCEELVSDYDDQIIDVLQKFADGSKENVEKSLCVDIAHVCSKKEYKRVGELRGLRA